MKKILLAISIFINLAVFNLAYAEDTTPPAITAPGDQTFTASAFPATPTLTAATATDDTDPNPVVTYDPTSFPVGTTTVTWTAKDASGNTSTATSLVTITDTSSPAETHLDITADVDVPLSCTVTDTDGVAHTYPSDTSANLYLGICAVGKAIQNGPIASIGLSNQYPSLGLFVTEINGVAADPNSQYWALYQNGNFAELGLTSLPVALGDKIVLELQDFSGNAVGDKVTINIRSLIGSTPASSGGGGSSNSNNSNNKLKKSGEVLGASTEVKKEFDIKKGFDFIISEQEKDGSFGEDLYTDWVAIALAGGENQSHTLRPTLTLIKYLSGDTLDNPRLTDFERRAMALMALGLNPYNTNGENYIAKIASSFDGRQFGDANEDNDDIFALIVLQNAGFDAKDGMITHGINFILERQKENGSWDESVDMTAAAIQALTFRSKDEKVNEAIQKGKKFLQNQQEDDGSWGNISSTAWVLGGILALEENPEQWEVDNNTPLEYVALYQDTNGSVKSENPEHRIWETAYMLTALSGKTWNEIMQEFEKAPTANPDSASGQSVGSETKTPIEKTPKQAAKKVITKTEETSPIKEIPTPVENQANAINALPDSPAEDKEEKGWFSKFFGAIFGF